MTIQKGTQFHCASINESELWSIIDVIEDGDTQVVVYRRENDRYVAEPIGVFIHNIDITRYTTYPTMSGNPCK